MESPESVKTPTASRRPGKEILCEHKNFAASSTLFGDIGRCDSDRLSLSFGPADDDTPRATTGSLTSNTSPQTALSPEKECRLALRWLKHTGFPHYVQLYESQQFPIVIDSDKLAEDHVWLTTYPDALRTLLDRLQLLNQYASANIPYVDEDEDSDDELSGTLVEYMDGTMDVRGGAAARHGKGRRRSTPLPSSSMHRQETVAEGFEEEVDEYDQDMDDSKPTTPSDRQKSISNPRVKLERGSRVSSRPKANYCRQASSIASEDEFAGETSLTTSAHSVSYDDAPVKKIESPDDSLVSTSNLSDEAGDSHRRHDVGIVSHSHRSSCLIEEEEEGEEEDECLTAVPNNRRQRWHSFSSRHPSPPPQENSPTQTGVHAQPSNVISTLTVSRMQMVRHMSLLKLTSQLECYITPHLTKSRKQKLINNLDYTRKKTYDYDRAATLFGVPLDVLTKRNGQPLPQHVVFALDYILCRGIETQGLFRVAGSSKRIRDLKKKISISDEPLDYSEIPICDIACLVKEYFRDIPGRLFTSRMTDTIVLIGAFIPEELQLQALQHTMLLLPDENRETIYCLLSFLRNVSQHHEKTKMDTHNLAVVFAPTLFHLAPPSEMPNGHSGHSGHSSPPSSRKLTKSKKRIDYDEHANAITVLEFMITQANELQRVPMDTLMISLHTSNNPLDFTETAHITELGKDLNGDGDYVSYVEFCMLGMLKEHNTGYKNGWIQVSTPHNCEVSRKKVRDGHELQLWRGVVDVPASPMDIQRRILRERTQWDIQLVASQCVEVLDDRTEIYQYVCSSTPSQPHRESVVLRSWMNREDINIIMATSVRHPKAIRQGGVVITELATRYVIEPLGGNMSRLTLIVRHDLCGRSLTFYKNYGPWSVAQVCKIRDSFAPQFVSSPRSRSSEKCFPFT